MKSKPTSQNFDTWNWKWSLLKETVSRDGFFSKGLRNKSVFSELRFLAILLMENLGYKVLPCFTYNSYFVLMTPNLKTLFFLTTNSECRFWQQISKLKFGLILSCAYTQPNQADRALVTSNKKTEKNISKRILPIISSLLEIACTYGHKNNPVKDSKIQRDLWFNFIHKYFKNVHLVGLSFKTNKRNTQHNMTERQDQLPQ